VDERVDLLIVGGGINGAGIARDAVGRGLKVTLVEQSDLAAATSSASSKLIHGGLRYLEQGEIRLVRESLRERERLLAIAPHLVYPLEFVLPHVTALRPRWQLRIGLFLYDQLGKRRRLAPSRSVKLANTKLGAALQGHIARGFAYSDCAADDARLVILNALDAAQRGATIHTRTRFVTAERRGGYWVATCVESGGGTPFEIRARGIVNAAGPWVDRVLRSLPHTREGVHLRLVKGSHIVVPRLYEGEHAFILQNPDGRVVFVIPYEGSFSLIGTTDVPWNLQPEHICISADETEYLCRTVNHYFRKPIGPSEVKWSYAGVRPLVDDESADAASVTRDYRLELDAAGPPLLSVFGGKLTTYRKLADAALVRLQPYIRGTRGDWSHTAPLPGGDLPDGDLPAFARDVRQRWPFLSDALALRLARSYGTRIEKILGSATRLEDLGASFGAGLTAAEIDYLITFEWAETAEDILWRRTKLGLHTTAQECGALARYLSACSMPRRVASASRS
jgi:glycerol-3-phosphate dehydrogenase